MASFCNKCGAPVSGVFCNKCGAQTPVAATPAPQPVIAPNPPVAAARFCNGCGSPVVGAFCRKCGTDTRAAANPFPAPVAPPPPVVSSTPSSVASTPAKGSPLVKILVGFVVVVVVLGALAAGGVYYVVYRVKQKVHEVARDVPGLGSSSDSGSSSGDNSVMGSISKMVSGNSGGSSNSDSNGGISGDPCRLLSKEEVSRAIGVGIVATETTEAGCTYLAQGDSADMTSKHMAAMMGAKGADAKTQQTIQALTGGMARMMQSEGHDTGMDHNGNVPVLGFSVDNHSAGTQMQLNQKVLGGLGPGQQEILNIGDQAFDEAGAMMMVRKGDKLIRIMYSTCPCSVENIKPLAKKLADRL